MIEDEMRLVARMSPENIRRIAAERPAINL